MADAAPRRVGSDVCHRSFESLRRLKFPPEGRTLTPMACWRETQPTPAELKTSVLVNDAVIAEQFPTLCSMPRGANVLVGLVVLPRFEIYVSL
jgi:hypothetical protein